MCSNASTWDTNKTLFDGKCQLTADRTGYTWSLKAFSILPLYYLVCIVFDAQMEAVDAVYCTLIIMFYSRIASYLIMFINFFPPKIDRSAILTEILLSVTTRLQQFSVRTASFSPLISEMEIFFFTFSILSNIAHVKMKRVNSVTLQLPETVFTSV